MERSFFNRYLFLGFLVIFIITFFARNNCRNVNEIHPALLNPPIQKSLWRSEKIEFTKKGYAYQLTPVYNYEINALIVSKMNYRLFSIYKTDALFPVDLCLIWGSNVKRGVYKNRSVRFSQDCRWCWAVWSGNVEFNLQELSNNHLLINSKKLERIVKSLVVGDQVKIKGKLVNVKANLVGKGRQYDAQELTWNSSVLRTDSGAGSCEVIYAEDIEILKKANVLSYYLFHISLFGLIILGIWRVTRFFVC